MNTRDMEYAKKHYPKWYRAIMDKCHAKILRAIIAVLIIVISFPIYLLTWFWKGLLDCISALKGGYILPDDVREFLEISWKWKSHT